MYMRLTIFLSFFLLIPFFTKATILQVSGDVSGTWSVDTVQVIDNLLVPDSQTLIINPGVKVIFAGHYRFVVEGQIEALGMLNDSISFFVSDTTGLYNLERKDGSWGGFWFENSQAESDSSVFEFCKFNYGKAVDADSVYRYGGAVCVRNFDPLRFSNCSFSNNIAYKNGGAIYCRESNIKIENCDFAENSCGTDIDYGYGGAICLEHSSTGIYHNNFRKNSSTGVGGGLSFEYSTPYIFGNVFDENFSAIGGGLGCIRSIGRYPIVNNLFDKNFATFFGGGVAFLEADVLFTNNSVVNNISMYAGGLYFNAAATPTIKNSIVWNNSVSSEEGPQVYVYDVYSAPKFYYNDIEGGFEDFSGSGVGNFQGVYEDNIDLDPDFVGTGDFPMSLSDNSPCINSGTPDTTGLSLPADDLAGKKRVMEDRVDIGCYENQRSSAIQNLSFENIQLVVSPNPVTENSIIRLNIIRNAEIEFVIVDSQGKLIHVIGKQDYSKGEHEIQLPSEKLQAGLYLLKAIEPLSKRTKTVKIVVQ